MKEQTLVELLEEPLAYGQVTRALSKPAGVFLCKVGSMRNVSPDGGKDCGRKTDS